MQECLQFFRVAARSALSGHSLSQLRGLASGTLSTHWCSHMSSLGYESSTSRRPAVTWGLGLAVGTPALHSGAASLEIISHAPTASSMEARLWRPGSSGFGFGTSRLAPGSLWSLLVGPVRWCQKGQLSRQRVPKGAAINDNIVPNTTQLKYGLYGIRALAGKRLAANTLEAVRRTLRRKLKKAARLWVRIEATVPVTRKPLNIRMGKGKGAIAFYATAVRPGQIIYEMDRVSRTIALQAMQAAQHKFPVKLGFIEWS